MRAVLGFVLAVIVLAVLGSISHAVMNQGDLAAIGAEFPIGDRISWAMHDIVGMGPIFGAIMSVGLLIAFIVAGIVSGFVTPLRTIVYVVAGAAAVIGTLMVLPFVFPGGVTAISSTRELDGTIGLAIAGALAGLTYVMVKRPA